MEFSDEVMTRGRGSKLELRALESRGGYVICKYLDPTTMKLADKKRKLTLKDENGKVQQFFIIPLRDLRRSLLVTAEADEKERKVWNEKRKREEDLWGGG